MIAGAAVAIAPWQVRFQNVEVPEPGPGEVLLKIEAVKICFRPWW